MTSSIAAALAVVVCGIAAAGRAAPAAAAGGADADAVRWSAHCDLGDGRRFLTDGALLVEAKYLPDVAVPEKSVGARGVERMLASETDHEFGPGDLKRKSDGGHYVAPGDIVLGHKYVELLRGSGLKGRLRFRGKARNDPVLILDGKKVVGVVMPIKS
jgi:hypothetical protein